MEYYKFTDKDRERWIERSVKDSAVKMSKSKKDTFYYSINTLGVTPLLWQMKLWDLLDAGHKRIAVCTPRQCGKSLGISAFALKAASLNIFPAGVNKTTKIGIISATEEQSKKVMANIRELIVLGDKHVEKMTGGKTKNHFTNQIDRSQAASNNKSTITFTNGNQIICLPPTGRVRGYSFSFVFVDEAAFIEEDDFYDTDIEPTTNGTDGIICLTSTPNGQKGFYYNFFDPDERYEQHTFKRFWLDYHDLPEDMIDRIEAKKVDMLKTGREKQFKQEYEALFTVQVEAFFDSEDVDNMFEKKLHKQNEFKEPCDLGVDFGMVNSHTTLTICRLNKDNVIERIYAYRYDFETDDNLIEDIAELKKRYNIQRIIPDNCLDKELEIMVLDGNKYVPRKLKDIKKGDLVLSYNFDKEIYESKKVLDSFDKGIQKVKNIKLRNGTSIKATEDHKFYYRHNVYHNRQGYKKYSELNQRYERLAISRELPDNNIEYNISDDLLYLYGIFIAEGSHHEGEGRCFLAQSKDKNPRTYLKIKSVLDNLGIKYSERYTGFQLFSCNEINKKLQSMGTYHYNKRLPEWVFGLSNRQTEILLNAMVDGDGHRRTPKLNGDGKKTNIEIEYVSTSEELIKQVSWLFRKIGKPMNLYSRLPSNRNHRQYTVSYNPNSWFNKEHFNGVSHISYYEDGEDEVGVWDINVEDNNNFVLYQSGLIVHNCAEGFYKIQEMEKRGWRTTPMSFKKDKVSKYTEFRSRLRQGTIKSYKDTALEVEMKAMQEEEGVRTTKIHKPSGGTDDLVDSFVMAAYHYLDVGSKGVRVYDW